MTDDDRYREWLAQASYKPGYQMSMHPGRVFSIKFTDRDSWGAERRGYSKDTIIVANVSGSYTVPPGLSRNEFYEVVSEVIVRHCEDHERLEWFKVNGVCLNDPHSSKRFELTPYEVVRRTQALMDWRTHELV